MRGFGFDVLQPKSVLEDSDLETNHMPMNTLSKDLFLGCKLFLSTEPQSFVESGNSKAKQGNCLLVIFVRSSFARLETLRVTSVEGGGEHCSFLWMLQRIGRLRALGAVAEESEPKRWPCVNVLKQELCPI